MNKYDIIIIGGGISGMTAAIYAARANLTVCIVEKEVCGGLVNWTHTVENFPSYPSIPGMELMEKCRAHVESLGVHIAEVEEIQRVQLVGVLKHVASEDEEYLGRAVIIATGRKPVPLPVSTEFEKVHYCSVCDGTAYKEKSLLVLGGGNSGFDESLYLAGLGVQSIHIIEAFPKCIASARAQDKARSTGKIRVSVSTELMRLDVLENGQGRAYLEDTSTGKCYSEDIDGVFCFIGQKPNTALFSDMLTMDKGYIRVSAGMETNVPGVFACGDVTTKTFRQITTAMGDGTIAALQAERYLSRS